MDMRKSVPVQKVKGLNIVLPPGASDNAVNAAKRIALENLAGKKRQKIVDAELQEAARIKARRTLQRLGIVGLIKQLQEFLGKNVENIEINGTQYLLQNFEGTLSIQKKVYRKLNSEDNPYDLHRVDNIREIAMVVKEAVKALKLPKELQQRED